MKKVVGSLVAHEMESVISLIGLHKDAYQFLRDRYWPRKAAVDTQTVSRD
jgi:hypothetical protein